jgi:Fe-S cluster biogenesis protein NfuA
VDPDVAALTQRVEILLAQFESRAKAEELLRTIVAIYGEGLTRMLGTIGEAPDGSALVERLCSDPFVASLLLIHDLHPIPLETRLERALESVRPYLRSHGGDVAITSIEGSIVDLQMSGTCDGCSASAATLKRSIERAVFEAAPEITEVRANTLEAESDLLPRVLS